MPAIEKTRELHELIAPAAEIVRCICDASCHRGLPDLTSNTERSRLTLQVMKMLMHTPTEVPSDERQSDGDGHL